MQDFYLWFKAAHVISIIAWMAGLLYLPRLFVYHSKVAIGSEISETFKIMERRLFRGIMNPALVASYFFGILMILSLPDLLKQGWFHAKMLCVLLLTFFHMQQGFWRKQFSLDHNKHSDLFYRFWNEAPTLMMIVIVILVIVKPF